MAASFVALYLIIVMGILLKIEIFSSLIAVLFFGLPETLLRRSWKVGAIIVGMITFMVALDMAIGMGQVGIPCSVGSVLGLATGFFGARSLMVSLVGLFIGVGSGMLSYYLVKQIDVFTSRSVYWDVFFIYAALYFPLVFMPGLSVCLGLRWSKRRASGTSTSS